MNTANGYAELELSLHGGTDGAHDVELRWSDPQGYGVQIARSKTRIDFEGLLALQLNHEGYGQRLSQLVFAAPNIRALFDAARMTVTSIGRTLRVQVVVGPSAVELDNLRWELLQDPETGATLATSEKILFSRLIYSSHLRSLSPRSRRHLRAVIAVSSPTNLAEYCLPTIDVGAAIDEVLGALAGTSTTVLGRDRPVTMAELVDAMRAGADIIYLLCHGTLGPRGDVSLFLQGENGEVRRADGKALAACVSDLQVAPSLMILAACESSGHNTATHPMLARMLMDAGLPAVLALQGQCAVGTTRTAMTRFLGELLRDGQIDRALAAARGAVRDQRDYWMPALFLRLRSGRLWTDSSWRSVGADPEDFFRAWLDPTNLHNHCWTIVGREPLCREVVEAVIGRTHRVHILEGRGGIGKSKVLFEMAQRLDSAQRWVTVYQERSLTSRDLLGNCPDGPHVLLVDDAHRLEPSELALLIELAVRHRPDLTVVFSCRPQGVEPIFAACANAGINLNAVFHRKIPNLDTAARVILAAEALGDSHGRHAAVLASCFPDSPLFITVAGRLVSDGSLSIEEIRSSDSLRRLIMSRFPFDRIVGTGSPGGEGALQAVIAVAALLQPLTMKEVLQIIPVATSDPNATQIVERLLDLGIFADVNDQLRILPDLFGSYTVLGWALPRQIAFGRVHKLYRTIDDPRLRHNLLRNVLDVRSIASPAERGALRAEIAEMWSECASSLKQSPEDGDWSTIIDLELMACELPSLALDLAEEMVHATGERRRALCSKLVTEALRQRELEDATVVSRGIEFLIRITREGRSNDNYPVLRELAANPWWTEMIVEALAEPVRCFDCPPELFECAIEIVARYLQTRMCTLTGPAQEPDTLLAHQRAADFLVAAAITCPGDRRPYALESILRTLVVNWGWWGREHSASITDIRRWNDRALSVLEALDRELAADGDSATLYSLRRALRECAWAAVPELAEPIFTLLHAYNTRIDPIDDLLDIGSLPHHLFVSRTRGRLDAGFSGEVEAIRTRVIYRLLGAGPNLARLRDVEKLDRLDEKIGSVIEDEILTSPAWVVQCGRTWVEHTIRTMGRTVLVQALTHHWPQAPHGNSGDVQRSYGVTRLDETYAGVVVHASDATRAVCAGHLYAILDVADRLAVGRDAIAALLLDADDATAVWRELQLRLARFPAQAHPRLAFLLHAIVEARPDLLTALAEAVPEGCATIDSLSPLLHALYARDPDEGRRLAERLMLRGGEPAMAVVSILPLWIGGGGDERELLRVALCSRDAQVLSRAYMAVGSMMARQPEESAEFILGLSALDFVPHLDALMRGFLTNHFIAESYIPRKCEHIGEWMAPPARAFAAHSIHPEGATPFEAVAQHGIARLLRHLEGTEAPMWDRLPKPLVERLLRGMVASDSLRQSSMLNGENCLTFFVEYARRRPRHAFSALLIAWVEHEGPVTIYPELIQAALRPLAGTAAVAEIFDELLGAARRERCAGRGRTDMSRVLVAARAQLVHIVRTRLDRCDEPVDEETLLDFAHLLRTLGFRHVFDYHKLFESLHARAEKVSSACLHRVSTLLPDIDERTLDQEYWRTTPEELARELARMDEIIERICQSSIRTLLLRLRERVNQKYRRTLRAAEV